MLNYGIKGVTPETKAMLRITEGNPNTCKICVPYQNIPVYIRAFLPKRNTSFYIYDKSSSFLFVSCKGTPIEPNFYAICKLQRDGKWVVFDEIPREMGIRLGATFSKLDLFLNFLIRLPIAEFFNIEWENSQKFLIQL